MEPHEGQFDAYLETDIEGKDIISDFYSWIQKLRFYNYYRVVVTTRRASNLLEAVRKKHPDVLPNYITENGLLLLAEEAATFYKDTGRFPKIAVVDDILVYGRSMNLLLSQFWSTIRQRLYQLDINADTEGVEAAFLQSVNLWIYAVNESPILLRHEFQMTMRCQQLLSESQWRSLSDSIARRISVEDVANTSYVVSVMLPYCSGRFQPHSASWLADRELCYRNNRQEYAFYLFSPASRLSIYPSVRSYRKRDLLCFTPYFFMPEISWNQMICLLKAIFDISGQQNPSATNECIRLLNRIKGCSSRMTVYAQLATLLLSQITLTVFLEQLDIDSNPECKLIYDTDKIAHNFGLPEGSDSILQSFCDIKWTESQLMELLDCLETPCVPDELTDIPSASRASLAEIVNTVERLTYKQAVDHERDAAGRLQRDLTEVPANSMVNQTGEQNLDQFLARVKEQTGSSSDTKSMLLILSCLTQMMDLGDISLKARFKSGNGTPVFYSSIRTTEMSLAIMPRKLSGHYWYFHLLARLYWRDRDFPDRVERYFRDITFAGNPDRRDEVLINNARYFAELIAENRMIAGSMLNWEIPPDAET